MSPLVVVGDEHEASGDALNGWEARSCPEWSGSADQTGPEIFSDVDPGVGDGCLDGQDDVGGFMDGDGDG